METWVSPKFKAEKLQNPSVGDLIDVFEDRMRGWFLLPAKKLLKNKRDHPASICLQLTYFEGIASFMSGQTSNRRSKQFFRDGFFAVFSRHSGPSPLQRSAADLLYEDARCGFFHDGMFRRRIYFRSGGEALVLYPQTDGVRIESILINPIEFFSRIEKHFDDYVATIRNPRGRDFRAKFKTMFMSNQGRCVPLCNRNNKGPLETL